MSGTHHRSPGPVSYVHDMSAVRAGQLVGFFDGWPSAPSAETHLAMLRASGIAVVAIDTQSSRVIGYVTALTDGVLAAYVSQLEVLPEYRGRGIGSTLMSHVIDRTRGLYMLDLVCDPELEPFYRRVGLESATAMIRRNRERQGGGHVDVGPRPARGQHIRPIVVGVFHRDGRILANRGTDPETGESFYRPLGGGIELGEHSSEALAREIHEEIGLAITEPVLLGVLENRFEYRGRPEHEIVFVYDARFADESVYARQRVRGKENHMTFEAEWRPIAGPGDDAPFVPAGLVDLVRATLG